MKTLVGILLTIAFVAAVATLISFYENIVSRITTLVIGVMALITAWIINWLDSSNQKKLSTKQALRHRSNLTASHKTEDGQEH